jgi:16S rRNA (guanine(1405)-N(7))-methyltransferase
MTDSNLAELVKKVRAHKKYRHITPDLVKRLAQEILSQGLRGKTAMKAVRNKLHQVGGAYFRQNIDYEEWRQSMTDLPSDLSSESVRQFCREKMAAHASTMERLPILERFFTTCLAPLKPVHSVLDLACGLNPLALPWMPLAKNVTYHACDIYEDMLGFLAHFFNTFSINASVQPCDLNNSTPSGQYQVAYLLKAIPCLEQIEKDIGRSLLERIPAQYILVSFPVRSLGGQQKGMPDFYRDHFMTMIAPTAWTIREFSFDTELAFLVSR